MEDLISTAEAAEILGVSQAALRQWRMRKLFGCYFFEADEKHGNNWYYYRERVEQLKAVYQKGVLQDMYKLEFLNSEAEEDDSEFFQNSVTRVCTEKIPRSSHKGFLTMDEVARDLGVDRTTIVRWAKENHLRWDLYDHHEKFLFKRETVEKFKARQQKRQQNIVSFKPTRDNRIAEAEKFFNLLYGEVHETKIGYLWTLPDKKTYSFDVSKTEARREMASKAIELNDTGAAVYLSVNLTDTAPAGNGRAKAEEVTMQTAAITDIDVRSDAHKGDPSKLAADFDEAKSFLPFTPSIIINSGYGLQTYYIFDTPLKATDDNREKLKRRNNLLLDVIRQRANGKTIDGVGDLSRVLRVPGTFNYKLGKDNAPLCHIVEANDVRFSPAELDERLNALAPAQSKEEKKPSEYPLFDTHDFDIWRAQKMLEVIPVAALAYDDWINIGIALKGNGNSCSDWEQWSRADERFKEGECESKWSGFDGDLTIATICDIAKQYGYDAKETYREWQELHPELSNNQHKKKDHETSSEPSDTKQVHTRAEDLARLESLRDEEPTPERLAEIRALIHRLADWNLNKHSTRTTIKNTVANAELIFGKDPLLHALVGFDSFSSTNLLLKNTPWKRGEETNEWTDADDAQCRLYLRRYYAEFGKKELVDDMLVQISQENSFNAVKKFLESLPKWDGIPRAETLFIDFLKAEDSPYVRELTLNWLTAAIARIYFPGCNYQIAIVLHGEQGNRKRILA